MSEETSKSEENADNADQKSSEEKAEAPTSVEFELSKEEIDQFVVPLAQAVDKFLQR
ncbi:hypothetical protein [Nostoc sp. C052]|uniref:hypothetical protein n=1 Tax=Nostoc sp. C052 TaxID=2576902 RepID=UPI0015C2FD8A|nr:hypothetical protein [Nostoc sp. C052]